MDGRLKDEFASYAKRHHSEESYGVVLARALRERRDGGRAGRVERKLERVQADAEAMLAEVAPGSEDGMSVRERRTVAICSRLGEQFTREELETAIGAVAGDSEPTLETYTDRVLDRLTYTTHPHNADLLVPETTAREIAGETDAPAPDAPAIERKAYRDLSREEKVHGLRVRLAERATGNGGRGQVDASTVREEVFDGRASEGHARQLMRLAGEAEGYTFGKRHGTERIRVDLADVTDAGVLDALTETSADAEDGTEGVDTRMDALMAAEPEVVPDGGREP